ncbi:HNH endonuclease family protein [Microtetraspora sp. NBRC 16547]|uniref:HNH endonuclease family protein n=1 Tax=Microtetraspora sp. NBRC 16547 TaxID=3030993 RepID=UPI00249FEC17|nr:HNH endonuclease family protein [Microtetraspora sp. NBRC 16547]GLW97940.1 lipoprotein [Microtetraspora sp. NBRC 16547]
MRARGSKVILGFSVAVAVLAGCGPLDTQDIGVDHLAKSAAPTPKSGGSRRGASPLDNPDGTRPGLAPITAAKEKAKARELIEKVATKKRGTKTGYDRKQFGYAWADNVDDVPFGRNGCDTRNDLLRRDGQRLQYRDGSTCILVSIALDDPYTGKTIEWRKEKAAEVQIDHVMPLSYDWQMGASGWSDTKRRQIANDPLNLLPVDGSMNASKGDSGPADWLPPVTEIRCSYAVRFAQVALKYELPVTAEDKATMLEQCA